MAIPSAPTSRLAASAGAAVGRASTEALVVAFALPVLFVHVRWLPGVDVSVGSGGGKLTLADAAILAIAAAALAAAARDGLGALRPARWLWAVAAGLLAWVVALTIWPGVTEDAYAFLENLVTAARWAEYAVLAPAIVLVARTARDLAPVLWSLALTSAVASAVGLAQFGGLDVLDAWDAGFRQPSFLGHHDFAALSGVGLGLGVAALGTGRSLPGGQRLALVAGVAGGLGLVLSGTISGAAGLVVAAAAVAVLAHRRFRPGARRLAALGGTVVVVVVASVLLRGGDVEQFLRFAGAAEAEQTTTEDVQTYSHRTVLAYIGLRIWADNPAAGLGWQASGEPWGFLPYVDDARRRFPDVAEEAFPADRDDRLYGVQNAYVQALADLGVVGLALFVGTLAAAVVLAARSALRAAEPWAVVGLAAMATLLVVAGVWAAQGLVSGQPIDAVTWIAAGLAAVAAAGRREQA